MTKFFPTNAFNYVLDKVLPLHWNRKPLSGFIEKDVSDEYLTVRKKVRGDSQHTLQSAA